MTGCTQAKGLLEEIPMAIPFWNVASHLTGGSERAATQYNELWQGQENTYVVWYVQLCLMRRPRRSFAYIILSCMELYNTIFTSNMLKGTI